ncbi:MAG TPA: lysylphosphatidylglycerol synthase transmembrane domain-containing protein [Vicinamibacterales bacterium]|nr:lysylphosphatidylglycerol synthase transmembrane domain-containing protein [Vicinamibacterales bacterium]
MKNSARTLLIVILSLGLLWLFLRGAHLDQVWGEIKRADGWWIALSLATTVGNMVIRAVRWQYLLAPIGHARFRPAFRTTMIGFAASTVLPARAGEIIRPYLLARQEGLSGTATFATVVVERLLDGATVVLLLAVYVLFFAQNISAGNALYHAVRVGGLAVGAGTVVILGLMFFAAKDPEAIGRWAYKLEHLLPGRFTHMLAEALQRFAEGLAVVRAPGRLLTALALSLPLWLCIAVGIWATTMAFHIEMSFTGSFLLLSMLVVGVAVPTPGGIGAFEAAARVGLTSFFAVDNDRAVGAALILHATSVLPTLALGFLFLIQDGLDFGSMRKMATAAAEGDAR